MRPAPTETKSPTARLWRGGGLIATLLVTLLLGNALLDPSRGLGTADLGHDFLAMYTAGAMVRDGRSADLYDLKQVQAAEAKTVDQYALRVGGEPGRLRNVAPWWYPPFFALAFAPLAALPYPAALRLWTLFNLGCLIAAMALLARMLGERADWKQRGLVPLLVPTSWPFILAISHGQNTFLSLLLLCGVATFWRAGNALAAGLIGGLLCYKPQLAAAVAAGLVLTLGGRALLGLLLSGGSLLVANVLLLPGTLGDWLGRLPANLATVRFEHVYQWDRHVTLLAFFRSLVQGRGVGETAWAVSVLTGLCGVVLALALCATGLRVRRPVIQDRLLAAVIVAMPLLMPFYFDYDLLLLAVPAALYAAERLGRGPAAADPWITRLFVALFLWLPLNAPVCRLTGVNGAVLLLSGLAALTIRRALEPTYDIEREVAADLRSAVAYPTAPRVRRLRPVGPQLPCS